MSDNEIQVSIVGAGPGDPELLTLKAHKRLMDADIVFHDGLFGDDILDLIPERCEKVYVGKVAKDRQDQTQRQITINQQILDNVNSGKKVVRLKTGDPLIFGRGIEEIRFLIDNNVSYEIIPGVTAGIAAANLMQIPLTERSVNSSVLFCTGSTVNEDENRLKAIAEMLIEGSPLVIYMGLVYLDKIVPRLLDHGVDPETRICIVSKVSQKGQSMLEAKLSNVFDRLKAEPVESPAVLFIGEHTHSLLDEA